jgi:hypothetical protein
VVDTVGSFPVVLFFFFFFGDLLLVSGPFFSGRFSVLVLVIGYLSKKELVSVRLFGSAGLFFRRVSVP